MHRLLALSLLVSLPALADGPRVAVVPFAALTGDVPPGAGAKAAGMLATELRSAGAGESAATETQESTLTSAATLVRARSAVQEAQSLREKRKVRAAADTLARALEDYAGAAAHMEDVSEVADAWTLRAAVQYAAGRDAEAEASLTRALALAPGRRLPLTLTSPLFAREVERLRQAVRGGPHGRVVIESTPPGATVAVDGVAYGATPLRLKDVPPGTHLWRVRLPSGEWVGGTVEVTASKEARVQAEAAGTSPDARIATLLARNRLDTELLAAARASAAARRAEALLIGTLRRDGASLSLEAFVFQAASGELRRLPRTTFDEDLLSAGQQFLSLASELARGGTLGEAVTLPAPVTTAALASPAWAEKAFDPQEGSGPAQPTQGPGASERKDEGARQPLKRAPLRRQ
ncbi:MAG: PEGA domain-containing protein [Myxococcaceae bacterium]|nr:PEGA domain-containing protein [Myxococcaceae bacterium]MCI0669243.1 PEGA domain-containing protein [Myxococcaceae bacterium]